jgi:uncharacterized protein YegP (UPF0339 family)
MYFTIKLDKDGWRGRLYSSSDLIWWTEGYVKKESAENAVRIAMATNNQTPVYFR